MQSFAAVLFDLDDTLHDDSLAYVTAAEAVAADLSREHRLDGAALVRAYVAEAQAFWAALGPDVFGHPLAEIRAGMWRRALAHVGISSDALARECAAAYDRHRRGALSLWPGVRELFAQLRASDLRLGLITNGFSETHRPKLDALGLADTFDAVLIADEVRLLKPDPRIFTLAAQRLGVAAERCAMVGDRYERDVAGGMAAGMFTVWINARGERPTGPAPDVEVRTIADVGRALAAAAA